MHKVWMFWLLVVTACPLFAQEFGPEVSVLGKTTFGINGLAVMEVTLPSEVSYNPAAVPLALDLFKENQYAEADIGVLDFQSGPQIVNDWQVYVFRLSDGAWRIARYGIRSDTREISYLGAGPQLKFAGQTIELSYGKKLRHNLFAGVSLVPSESVDTDIFYDNEKIVSASATSDPHGRLGIVYLFSPKLSVGAVYAYDRTKAKTRVLPIVTESLATSELSATYRERLWTTGVAYQPLEGTSLFWTWQKGTIKGSNVSEEIDLQAFGLQQFLSQNLYLRIERNDRVWGYGLTYLNHGWTIGASYSKNTYRRTEEYFGRADTAYLWIGKSW